jgi:hypothetical protein
VEAAEDIFAKYFEELYPTADTSVDKTEFMNYVKEKLPQNESLGQTFID